MKIVVLDGYAANPGDLSWDGLKKLGDVTIYDRTPANEVISRCKDAEVVLTNKVIIDSNVLSQLPKLKYIGVLATGYNVIDIETAKSRGVVVTNISGYSTDSVAQMTFAHIMNITNQVAHYAHLNREGRWSSSPDFCYWDTPLSELSGKTIGIVGLGSIGKKVACIARMFGMDVFAYTSKNSTELPEGIQKTTMDGLLAVSDILTLHCPLTESTYHLINREALSKMKPTAILINTSRGALVDEQTVADALENGLLAGYGADVMSNEPPAKNNPLLKARHAYITPHIAWATPEARQRLMKIAVENVRAYVNGKPVNVVD